MSRSTPRKSHIGGVRLVAPRDSEGEAYDIMWVWDRYLRALFNILYFSVSTAKIVYDIKRSSSAPSPHDT